MLSGEKGESSSKRKGLAEEPQEESLGKTRSSRGAAIAAAAASAVGTSVANKTGTARRKSTRGVGGF